MTMVIQSAIITVLKPSHTKILLKKKFIKIFSILNVSSSSSSSPPPPPNTTTTTTNAIHF